MSEKEQPPIMDQKLCVNGCGFFGSSNTSHMCSKCWKDTMSQTMRDAEGKKDGVSSVPLPSLSKVSSMEDVAAAAGVVGLGLNLGLNMGNKENDSSNNLHHLQQQQQQQQAQPASPLAPTPPAAAAGAGATTPVAAAPELPASLLASTANGARTSRPTDVAPATSPKPTAVEAAAAAVAATAAAAEVEAASLPLSPAVYFGAGARGAGPAIGGGGVGVDGGAAAVAVAAVAEAAADTPALPEQKNRKRCFTCSKKVGYTGIACRCNYVFCSLHRYPEQHGCTFDFKTSDRNDLKRTVVGGGQFSKVDRL